MGEGGLPTAIDFSKEYVIAVVKPATDHNITITPVSLRKGDDKRLVFTYRVEVGEKRTFTIRPCLIIVVDNSYDGDIVLKEAD